MNCRDHHNQITINFGGCSRNHETGLATMPKRFFILRGNSKTVLYQNKGHGCADQGYIISVIVCNIIYVIVFFILG